MSVIRAYFSNTMVDALKEQKVNIASIEDAGGNHKIVTIIINDGAELFSVFAAGAAWREKSLVEVGS